MLAFGFAGLGIPELAIILLIVLIFFGAGKLPSVLGQMGKGVKAFKDGMKDPDEAIVEAENDQKLNNPDGYNSQNMDEVTEAEEIAQKNT